MKAAVSVKSVGRETSEKKDASLPEDKSISSEQRRIHRFSALLLLFELNPRQVTKLETTWWGDSFR